jgi:hypothetical protein
MRLLKNLGTEGTRLPNRRVKRAHLKPEEHAETVRCCIRVAKVWMPMCVPRMKLQNNLAVRHYLFVLATAVSTLATEYLLVPTAAALNILHSNQRLSFHDVLLKFRGRMLPGSSNIPRIASRRRLAQMSDLCRSRDPRTDGEVLHDSQQTILQ